MSHGGQEFNYVVDGSITLVFQDREIVLNAGDSIYFNPNYPHGQRCNGAAGVELDTGAVFLQNMIHG